MSKTFAVGLISIVLLFAGCSTPGYYHSQKITPGDFAKNYKLLTNFYCEKKRWPLNGDEINSYASENDRTGFLSMFTISRLSVPREVQLDIEYSVVGDLSATTNQMAFIAAPCRLDDEKSASVVRLAAGEINFPYPAGWRELNSSEIEHRYGAGRGPYPDYVFLHPETNALITIRFGETPLSSSEMKATMRLLKRLYQDSTPGISWKKSELTKINGETWIHLQLDSDSSLGRLSNDMYFTDFRGNILSISFIAPTNRLTAVNAAFAKVLYGLEMNKETKSSSHSQNRLNYGGIAKAPAGEIIGTANPGKFTSIDVLGLKVRIPSIWSIKSSGRSESAPYELELVLKEEPDYIRFSILAYAAKTNAEALLDKFQSTYTSKGTEEKSLGSRKVKIAGQIAVCRKVSAVFDKLMTFHIEGCALSGDDGTKMIIMAAPDNLFKQYQEQFSELLAGMSRSSR